MMGLTKKQKECFSFIRDRIEQDGIAPSFDEMMDHLGLRSKSGVHRLIVALEQRNYIKRINHCARAIAIVADDSPLSAKWDSAALRIMRVINEAKRQHLSRTQALDAIYEIARQSRMPSPRTK